MAAMQATVLGTALAAAASLPPASGQKLPLKDGSNRIIQIVEVPTADAAGEGDAGDLHVKVHELAVLARSFVVPPLEDGEDVQPLGKRR